jgi:hypothetical protein
MNLFNMYKGREDVPRFNKELVNGLSTSELRDGVEYMNNLMYQIKDTFVEGLSFEGAFLADPIREVERSLIRGSVNTLKMEYSATAMMELRFNLQGSYAASAFMRIPYMMRGGKTILNGRVWTNQSVMVDRGINIRKDSMFIFLSRARYSYHRTRHEFLHNGLLNVDNILTGRLHQQSESNRKASVTNGADKIRSAEPSILLYPLMECGFVQMCKKYFGVDVIVEIGEVAAIRSKYPFPTAIYTTTGNISRYVSKERWRDTSKWNIIIAKDTELSQKLAVNLLYLLDIFSMDLTTVKDLDDTELWKLIAGKFIFNTDDTPAKLIDKVEKHLDQSISRLVDDTTRNELLLDGIDVNTPNELIAWLTVHTDQVVRTKEVNSVANKRLASSRYAFGYLQQAVTNLSYAMKHLNASTLNAKRLGQLLRTHFREGALRHSIVSDTTWQNERHAADNVWVYTRVIVQQGNVRAMGKKSVKLMYLPENRMHGSRLTTVQVPGLPKSDPSGMAYVNPFIAIDSGGRITPMEEYTPAVNALTAIIKQHG